jgi:predicted nucleic acid-binding protein
MDRPGPGNAVDLTRFARPGYEFTNIMIPFLPDPKDDHVLELAVASGVRSITTFNRNDFKGSEDFGVEILSPKRLLEEIKWVP